MFYTYKIGWSKFDKFYYGVRTGNKRPPEEDLWIEYFTSSNTVKAFRQKNGEPDIILIDKLFTTIHEALDYEFNYIKENKLHLHDSWLNKACWPSVDNTGMVATIETRTKMSLARKGKKLPQFTDEHRRRISDAKKGQIPWNKGIAEDPKITKKRSMILTGRKMTDESSRKKSEKLKGRPSPNKGNRWKMTNEQILRRQETRKQNAILRGKKY